MHSNDSKGLKTFLVSIVLVTLVLWLTAIGCAPPSPSPVPTPSPTPSLTPSPTPSSSSTPTPGTYSQYQLEYKLIDHFGEPFWCDPEFYPVGRVGLEEQNSLEKFDSIRSNTAEFSAILQRLAFANKADYIPEEKLAIYRQHKTITGAIQMTAADNGYTFALRVGEGQGKRLEGRVSTSADIKVLKEESSFNTCPICLAKGTLIDTSDGAIPVEQLRTGMRVWTVDSFGNRVAAEMLDTAMTPVPVSFQVVRLVLSDGRTVTASPGHPTANWRALGDYVVGETLDGVMVVSVERIPYDGGTTYDLLPAGPTGLYWANGVLLKSTLVAN